MLIGAGIGIPFQQNVLARLLGSAEFFAPLTHSAIPTRAAFGTTGTFTRATTSTWPNNDGYMVTGVAGEIGFVGTRRVYNALQNASIPSQDFSVAAWAASGVKSVTANYATAPDGTTTADRVVIAAGDYLRANTNLGSSSNSKTWLGSVYVKATSGTQTFRIGVTQNGVANNYSSDLVATSEWQRFSFSIPFTSGGSGLLCGIADKAAGGGTDLVVWGYQVEDVTAQTTQTAGEYVSVGVTSAPYYHGSFVDGVKCFPTDINGSPIPSSTLLGYQAEGARTNLCLQSNAFTTTWLAIGTPAPTQNATGPDGGVTAWTLTDNDGATSEEIYQLLVLTAAAHTLSVFVGKTVGVQSSYPCLLFSPAVGTANFSAVTIDTTNGIATAWTAYTGRTMASGISASCVSYNDDFWRVSLTATATAEAWYVELFPAATSNATQSTGTLDATVTGSAVFYGAQVELGSFASSYIPTTTIAVTRNADVLTYPSAGNIDGTKGWCYAEAITNSSANHGFVGFDSANQLMSQSNQKVSMYDGANQAVSTSAITLGAQFKGAVTWGSAGVKATINGEAPGSNASFDGDAVDGKANIYIGEWNGGSGSNFGTIRNVRIGQRALSSSELQAVTS